MACESVRAIASPCDDLRARGARDSLSQVQFRQRVARPKTARSGSLHSVEVTGSNPVRPTSNPASARPRGSVLTAAEASGLGARCERSGDAP